MQETPFVFVDIETNGANGSRGRVIEVAAIKVIRGNITATFQSLVNPGGPVPYWITSLTGITNHQLADAPYFNDIADQLYEFLDGTIFVAHNVLFDYSFLKRELKDAGYNFAPKLFCTVKMSRKLYPEHRGHSLEKIIQRHGIFTNNRHRAYDDALAIYEFTKLAIREKGADAFGENLLLQTKTKSLPPNVDEQTISRLPQGPGIYIFEDNQGLPLYIGKSINIRSRVRSHFTNATAIAKEMRLSLQSHNIRYIETETEVEALLLESAQIKQLQPVYNRRLRRKTSQSVLVKSINPDGYLTISVENRDLSTANDLSDIYGVYQTRAQAKNSLESVARTYQLCPILLGLEKGKGPCFRSQLGLCRGACVKKESPESYNKRVEFALQRSKIDSWPFDSKILVKISSKRSIIIDQWIVEGIVDHQEDDELTRIENGFDIDTYRIIRSFIRTHNPPIKILSNLD